MRMYTFLCVLTVWASATAASYGQSDALIPGTAEAERSLREYERTGPGVGREFEAKRRRAWIAEQEKLAVDCPNHPSETWHLPSDPTWDELTGRTKPKPPGRTQATLVKASPDFAWFAIDQYGPGHRKVAASTRVIDRDKLPFAEQVKVWTRANIALESDPDKKEKWPADALERPKKQSSTQQPKE